MKKIILSLALIAAVATAGYLASTSAFFTDTETSTGNTFTAGNLDLKIDSTCHYDGMICAPEDTGSNDYVWKEEERGSSKYPELLGKACSCSWDAKDLNGDRFFDFADIKPGDSGENTISVHVDNNDAYGYAVITALENRENGCTEPERTVEQASGQPYPCVGQWCGELAQNTEVRIWIDNCLTETGTRVSDENCTVGDNIHQPGEVFITNPENDGWRTLYPNASDICDESDGAVNYTPNNPPTVKVPLGVPVPGKNYGFLTGGETYYYGVEWRVPDSVDNIIQGDSMKANIQFEIEQARHNNDPFNNTI